MQKNYKSYQISCIRKEEVKQAVKFKAPNLAKTF